MVIIEHYLTDWGRLWHAQRMGTTRALTQDEAAAFLEAVEERRMRAFYTVALNTGYRVSEMLSMSVGSVWRHGRVLERVVVPRHQMKGKHQSRQMPLNADSRWALWEWIQDYREQCGDLSGREPLWPAVSGATAWAKNLSRMAVDRHIKFVAARLGFDGGIASHSLRKTFAVRVYHLFGYDLRKTQKALGHKSIAATAAYLESASEDELVSVVNELGLGMSRGCSDGQTEFDNVIGFGG